MGEEVPTNQLCPGYIYRSRKLTMSFPDLSPTGVTVSYRLSRPSNSHSLLQGIGTRSPGQIPRRHCPVHRARAHSRTCSSENETSRETSCTDSIVPTKPLRAHCMSLFRGLRRELMSIGIWDHWAVENGGVREGSGIQWVDETSV
jgi:hypothetical protein